jgi:hypothetical protein
MYLVVADAPGDEVDRARDVSGTIGAWSVPSRSALAQVATAAGEGSLSGVERPAQTRNMCLKRLQSRRRCLLAPEIVDQRFSQC